MNRQFFPAVAVLVAPSAAAAVDDDSRLELSLEELMDVEVTSVSKERQRTDPTLVVGDTPGFAMRGGMVDMATVDAKVRFRINLKAARRVGMGMSARLLSLATVVKQ